MGNEPAQVQGRLAMWQRALVPSDWFESTGRRSARDWVVDSLLFAVAGVVGGITLGHLWDSRSLAVDVLDVVFGSAACLSVWARRSRPLPVVLLGTAGVFFALAQGAALIAIFNAAERGRPRTLVTAAVLAVAGSIVFPLVNPAAGSIFEQRFPGFMLTAIAFGWGLFVRARSQLVVSLRERADRSEADQQRSIEEAGEAERRRIAREMHDVLAHRLSLLSIHAGALEFRPDAPVGEITKAAAVIRASAVAALDELRQVIAVLREDTASTEPPQPTLAQLPALLEESRGAGMRLRAHLDVPGTQSLPTALGRTAYRVVQEGLTNARKHAPGAEVDVTVACHGPSDLTVEVVSHPGTDLKGSVPLSGAGQGSGLIGLAERLALVGGELEHGTTNEGGFVLRATIQDRS
jgi:signal transduction histidine kinase